jgi:hypothetical protein
MENEELLDRQRRFSGKALLHGASWNVTISSACADYALSIATFMVHSSQKPLRHFTELTD